MCYFLSTRLTIQILEQYIRKQDGIHSSGIQIVGLSSIQMAFSIQPLLGNLNTELVCYQEPHCIPIFFFLKSNTIMAIIKKWY